MRASLSFKHQESNLEEKIMPVFGSGKHHGSKSRQDFAKRRKQFMSGEIPYIVQYVSIELAMKALVGGDEE